MPSTKGLPVWGSSVGVGPPLFARAPSCGLFPPPWRSLALVKPQVVSSAKLKPCEFGVLMLQSPLAPCDTTDPNDVSGALPFTDTLCPPIPPIPNPLFTTSAYTRVTGPPVVIPLLPLLATVEFVMVTPPPFEMPFPVTLVRATVEFVRVTSPPVDIPLPLSVSLPTTLEFLTGPPQPFAM